MNNSQNLEDRLNEVAMNSAARQQNISGSAQTIESDQMSFMPNNVNNQQVQRPTTVSKPVISETVQSVETITSFGDTVASRLAEQQHPVETVTTPAQMPKVDVNMNDNMTFQTKQHPVSEVVQPEVTIPTTATEEPFISDAFNQFSQSLDTMKEQKEEPNKYSSILDSIKVDLSTIEIVNEDDLGVIEMSMLQDAVLEDNTTMFVTCCQSSYSAEVTALKSQEIQNLANSDVDYYSYKKRLFQLINKHMVNTSVGKIDYGKWLHVTSYFDIDTLLYGIYCQTFNYQNKYSITCPKCRASYDAIVNNSTLVELRGNEQETFAKINEIVQSVHNADELVANSQVHKTKRIILEESKIIVDIQIPSAYDYLEEVVSKADDDRLEEYQNAIGLSLFIKDIYLPNVLLYSKTGKLNYVKINAKDKAKMLTTISNLSYYDSLQLSDDINNFIEKYRVTYSIRNLTCPHCGYTTKSIALDMEEVLFNTIKRGRTDR